MAIWREFRRAGYGRDLVTLLGATARGRGADRITWWRILRDHRSGRPA